MKLQRIAIALTVINLALLLIFQVHVPSVAAQGVAPVLRGQALEIADERGQVRARINVEAAVTMPDGKAYPEAVVFRLSDPTGMIRVTLSRRVRLASAPVVLFGPRAGFHSAGRVEHHHAGSRVERHLRAGVDI